MPRIATNYETTEVSFYRFVCNDPEIKSSYVGHTVNFRERKKAHKTCCNNPNDKRYHLKIYQIIREHGGFDNWRMIEIESRLVKDKREAERIEQEWIEKLEADLNSHKAFGGETIEEYRNKYHQDHKAHKREYDLKYRLENSEKLKEQSKEKVSCECGCITNIRHMPRHKKSPKHAELMELKSASADI